MSFHIGDWELSINIEIGKKPKLSIEIDNKNKQKRLKGIKRKNNGK